MRLVEAEIVSIGMIGSTEKFSYDNCEEYKESFRKSHLTCSQFDKDGIYNPPHPTTSGLAIMEYVNYKGEKVRRGTRQVKPIGETIHVIELRNGKIIDIDPISPAAIIVYILISLLFVAPLINYECEKLSL